VQVDSENHLVPVDARLKRKSLIKYETYALNDAHSRMAGRGAGSVNLVILYAAKPVQTASDHTRDIKTLCTTGFV
jgi:hypothetical protein